MDSQGFALGDKVMLVDRKKRRYLIDLVSTGEFHSHAGFVPHLDIVGCLDGAEVVSTKGARYLVLRPTLEDFVVEMPRGAQVIYPKDLATILMIADIRPGVKVLESLLHVNETIGTTTLLITHNADIARIGDRVVHFADGMIRNVEVNARRVAPSQVRW